MPVAAIWLLVFAMPLASWQWGADPGVHLRLVVVGVAAGLTIIGGRSKRARLPVPLGYCVLAAVGVFVVAALLGRTPVLSLLGRFGRYEGLPMLGCYWLLLWLGARLLSPEEPRLRGHALTALAAVCGLLGVMAIAETLVNSDARLVTALGNASDVGLFGVVAFAFLTWFAIDSRSWLLWLGAVAAVILVALSASRGAWLAALVVVLLGGGLLWREGRLRAGRPVLILVAIGAAAVLVTPLARSRGAGSSPLAEQTASGRLLMWQETLQLIREHLFFGVGPSRYVDEIGAYHTSEWAAVVGPASPPDSPHNVILQVLASTGAVGLVAAIAFGVVLVRLLAKRPSTWSQATLVALTAAAVALCFHFTNLWTLGPLLVLTGGAVSVTSEARHRLTTGLAAVVALSAVVLGGIGVVTETLLLHGVQRLQSGDRSGLELLDTAGRIKPWDADLSWRVGHALTLLGETQQSLSEPAAEVLGAACTQLPHSVACLNDLGDAQSLEGDDSAALNTWQESLRYDPTNVDTWLRLGSAMLALGDVSGAERSFLRAAELRPSAPEPWENLAVLYDSVGRTAEATAARERAAELRSR